MQARSIYSVSPSFNSYSSDKISEIAARVVEELKQEQQGSSEVGHDMNIFNWDDHEPEKAPNLHAQKQLLQPEVQDNKVEECQEEDDNDDDEFEFAVVYNDQDESPISADEIFYNGQIKPIYPVFNRDILLFQDVHHPENKKDIKTSPASPAAIRLPLRKLFREEQTETTTSCSSSDDELEGAQPGTYCVWKPKAEQCKKSNSTGSSSKRWKFRDLLQRSSSDGKETFVFLTTLSKKVTGKEKKGNGSCGVGKKKPSKHEIFGLFTNVNGLSRNLHPF